MMIEGYISRESDNPGYYRVVPSMGGGAVEAIDIHRVGNFVAGERVTIIQVGNEYGIAKKTTMLPGVLEVPKTSREAMAQQNPAQYFCAYLGAQLGRFRRLYETGTVTQEGDGSLLVQTSKGIERLSALAVAGMRTSDFFEGDEVIIKRGRASNAVAGWWGDSGGSVGLMPMGQAYSIVFAIRSKNGSVISSRPPLRAWLEFGRYVYEGDETGTPGTFEPFGSREERPCEVIGGQLVVEFNWIPIPCDCRLTYEYNGEWLSKTFSLEFVPFSISGKSSLTIASGSTVSFVSWEDATINMADFSGKAAGYPAPNTSGFLVNFNQGSILTNPTFWFGYSSVELKNTSARVAANGAFSISAEVGTVAPGDVFINKGGSFRVSGKVPSKWTGGSGYHQKATGSINTFGEINPAYLPGPTFYYDVKTPINCDCFLAVSYDLVAKPYKPEVVNRPPWAPSSDLPEFITVTGAGTSAANGEYTLDAGAGAYFKETLDFAIGYDSDTWFIVLFDGDIVFLYYNETGSESEMPKTGWQVLGGDAPAPTIGY